MSALVGAALRAAAGAVRAGAARGGAAPRHLTRSLWHASRASPALLRPHAAPGALPCACGCGAGRNALHTKVEKNADPSLPDTPRPIGERELVEFLTEEIVAERKAQKLKSLPTEVDGFQVKGDGAEVVLTKQFKDETVNVTFNVNHTVDSEENAETDPRPEKPEFSEMRSRPQFEVDLVRGGATLSFTCSFLQDQSAQEGEEYNDIFGIDELTMYQGEWNDKTYAVAGDVLDGYLYDLLMNVLEEKGISNEFVQKLSDFSTAYEHTAYINLLEGLSKFTIGK